MDLAVNCPMCCFDVVASISQEGLQSLMFARFAVERMLHYKLKKDFSKDSTWVIDAPRGALKDQKWGSTKAFIIWSDDVDSNPNVIHPSGENPSVFSAESRLHDQMGRFR